MDGERSGSLVAEESGQDLAEYALLIGLIALVVVTYVGGFGTTLAGFYSNIVDSLPF